MSEPVHINLNLDDPFNNAGQFDNLDDRLVLRVPGTQINPGANTILRPIGGLNVGRPGSAGNPAGFTDACTVGCSNGCTGTCGCQDELGF